MEPNLRAMDHILRAMEQIVRVIETILRVTVDILKNVKNKISKTNSQNGLALWAKCSHTPGECFYAI